MRCRTHVVPRPQALGALRARCADGLAVLAPLDALHALNPAFVSTITDGLTGDAFASPATLQETLARRVIAQLRALVFVPLPDEPALVRLGRVAARQGVQPLHACALPVRSPGWTWYESALGESPAWPELLLYAAATYDLNGYDAACDAAREDARVDSRTLRTIDDLARRSWEATAKNSGNYFWTDRDRVAGRLRCPADIHHAIRADRAGGFARAGLAGIPAYAAYIVGDTDNFYLDVIAEDWNTYVGDHLAWSPTVLATVRRLWRDASMRRGQLRRLGDRLREPAVWPVFLRAYRGTLEWCFGPGRRDL